MLFTTNKPPLTAWGDVLHDHDLAEAIVDRVLEHGRRLLLDGPSYRTRHLDLPAEDTQHAPHQPATVSGNHPADFPEPTDIEFAAALGLAHVGAIGSAVTGTGEAVGPHEGVEQQRVSAPVVW